MMAFLLWVPLLANTLLPQAAISRNSLPGMDSAAALLASRPAAIPYDTSSFRPGEKLAVSSTAQALAESLIPPKRPCCASSYLFSAGPTSLDRRNQAEASDGLPVPEPASLFLLGTGLLGIAALLRRRVLRSRGTSWQWDR